jgi:hypothetical protein
MINLELLVIETATDGIVAAFCDIYDFEIDDTECDNCGMLVGPVNNDFFPCVLAAVVDDGNEEEEIDHELTIVCIDCAGGVLFPGLGRETL